MEERSFKNFLLSGTIQHRRGLLRVQLRRQERRRRPKRCLRPRGRYLQVPPGARPHPQDGRLGLLRRALHGGVQTEVRRG